ncbi:hypothetical protein ABL78_7178 [Leptomonas seymouri]|uniref:Uncharacterized protein n=1 Tax=Leptomonas seymouri TaxID=5684 RepID=A0A0N1HZX8_LEPSE|nr:hypothetical protein ABL78_7178 [Leptomonas seymouri]|eukprot:KPI83778.1 hypothetical protein ABL78_7178 [Leptomonas seymouri]
MTLGASTPESISAALLAEQCAGATSHNTSDASFSNGEVSVAAAAATSVIMKVAAARVSAVSPSSHASSPPTGTVKQRQRLLARRHLNLLRIVHPRMSPLEAQMILSNLNSHLSGLALEERRMAAEEAFWEESLASSQQQ